MSRAPDSKVDCTCVIISFCVLVNIALILIVAFQENQFVKESHFEYETDISFFRTRYNFELIDKYLRRFKDNIFGLDCTVQRLSKDISNTIPDLVVVNMHISNFDSTSSIKERIAKIDSKFDELEQKFLEIKSTIDDIKREVEEIDGPLYMAEAQSLMGGMARGKHPGIDLESMLEDSSSDEYSDYNYDQQIYDKVNVEKALRKFPSFDYEESDSKETTHELKVFLIFREQVNWTEAVRKCEVAGLRLASISSSEEQADVVETIHREGLGQADFWTSGNDLSKPGTFVWSTTGSEVTYTNWSPGEPNNAFDSLLQEREDCLSLDYDISYRWDDSACGSKKYFICEVED